MQPPISPRLTSTGRKILQLNVEVPEGRAEEVMKALDQRLPLVFTGLPGLTHFSSGFEGPDARRFRLEF